MERLSSGQAKHSFGKSIDYDVVLDDGSRLAPKAVFGLAASEALGYQVQPHHFLGGRGTFCFKTIQAAGFQIVKKGQEITRIKIPPEPEELSWTEGDQRLVAHLRRERRSGLSKAKKSAFKQEHGRLYCEECSLDPVARYGIEVGEACIEVHHKLPLGSRQGASKTKLEDLMCVCASCHRIIHFKERKKSG